MRDATNTNLSVNQKSDNNGDPLARRAVRVGYARVSTLEQDVRLQRKALAEAGCVRTFEDKGVSGASAERPGLGAALAALSHGDVLVVWRLDRLGRSLAHLVSVVEDLDSRGIGLTSLTENIDSKSSGGRLVLHVMAALAEFERALIAERTRAGLAAARAAGQRLGRPPRLTSDQRSDAALALGAGVPPGEVARAYGVHPRTIVRAARHEEVSRDDGMKRSPSWERGP